MYRRQPSRQRKVDSGAEHLARNIAETDNLSQSNRHFPVVGNAISVCYYADWVRNVASLDVFKKIAGDPSSELTDPELGCPAINSIMWRITAIC